MDETTICNKNEQQKQHNVPSLSSSDGLLPPFSTVLTTEKKQKSPPVEEEFEFARAKAEIDDVLVHNNNLMTTKNMTLEAIRCEQEDQWQDKKKLENFEKEKYFFTENAINATKRRWEELQQFEENHHLLERIREFTEDTYSSVMHWADHNKLVEQSQIALTKRTAFAVMQILECMRPDTKKQS